MTVKKTTFAFAKVLVKSLGFSLTKRDGEYRLAPLDGTPATREARAHYTTDLDDAIGTAHAEYKRRDTARADAAADAQDGGVPVHRYETTGDAYDDTQCNEQVHDGDVLVVASEGVVGILVKAWPIAITAARGAFHSVKPGDTVSRFVTDEYPDTDYRQSLVVAHAEAALLAPVPAGQIVVRYRGIDGYAETRSYGSIAEAQVWPQRMIGAHPSMGSDYAISDDGIGKVTVTGCKLADIFPGADGEAV